MKSVFFRTTERLFEKARVLAVAQKTTVSEIVCKAVRQYGLDLDVCIIETSVKMTDEEFNYLAEVSSDNKLGKSKTIDLCLEKYVNDNFNAKEIIEKIAA